MSMPVAITGVGIVSALGWSAEETFERLCAGHTGLALSSDWLARGPVGEPPGEPTALTSDLAITAARQALPASFDGEIGLVGASTSGDMALGEVALRDDRRGDSLDNPDHYLWRQLCHAPFQRVRAELGLLGPSLTFSTACTSGTCAVGTAAAWVRSGRVPAALALGADALCRTTLSGFGSLGVYSPSISRPFDRDRSGMNIGAGAGALFLEPLDRAQRAGRPILALIAGYGTATDAHHLTAPEPSGRGAQEAIRHALGDSDPSSIGYVNAHGTGTQLNDAMESHALLAQTPRAAVSSLKGALGHTLGAAGAIEAAITALALHHGRLPPNVGLTSAESELDFIRTARQAHVEGALSVNFAFGGHNAALYLRHAAAGGV